MLIINFLKIFEINILIVLLVVKSSLRRPSDYFRRLPSGL
jgi:hypothetical protein